MQTPISYFTELTDPHVDRSIADYIYINQLFTSFHSQNKCKANPNSILTFSDKTGLAVTAKKAKNLPILSKKSEI
jgi:hypothetical protein